MATAKQPGMGPAFTLGETMFNRGKGLLSQPIANNGYGQNFGKVAPNGFGQVDLNATTLNNPQIKGMVRDIRNQTNDFLGDALMGIQGNSVASGGLGGSRQGVAQGTAIGKAADFLSGNIANTLGGMWENQANRNMQQYGLDQQFYLGNRGQDIQRRGQNMEFFSDQRGQDLAQAGLGADLIRGGLQTQWLPQLNASDIYSKYTGFGPTTTSSKEGGGWLGAIGGGLGGLQFAQNMWGMGNDKPAGMQKPQGWW